jgi:hypothetical protein
MSSTEALSIEDVFPYARSSISEPSNELEREVRSNKEPEVKELLR